MTISMRALAVGALGFVLAAPSLHSQGRSRYRDFQLGGESRVDLGAHRCGGVQCQDDSFASGHHAGAAVAAPVLDERQTLEQTEPVKQIVFSFYNDQLSKMVVDYDQDRTAGMTDADLIDAISTEYGPQSKPGPRTGRGAASQVEEESGTSLARWAGADYSVVLYRSRTLPTSGSSWRLRAWRLSRERQTFRPSRLDDREAPRREIARKKKETEDLRASQEKARLANRAAFRP